MQSVVEDNKASKCDTNSPFQLHLCSLQCSEPCKDLKLAFSYVFFLGFKGILFTLWHCCGFGIKMKLSIQDIMNTNCFYFDVRYVFSEADCRDQLTRQRFSSMVRLQRATSGGTVSQMAKKTVEITVVIDLLVCESEYWFLLNVSQVCKILRWFFS